MVLPLAEKQARKIKSGLDCRIPSLIKMMKPSHVSGCFWLGIPKKFCTSFMSKEKISMTLVDPKGEKYIVTYIPSRTGLSGGWKGFAEYHNLRKGDAVLFQLVNLYEFKVYIVRENGVADTYGGADTDSTEDVDGNISLLELKAQAQKSAPGCSGYKIHQYKLKRIEGQPPVKGKQVKFTNAGRARKAVDDGVVCKDISGGNENVPIRAINLVDNPQRRVPPTGLNYITTSQRSASVEMPRDISTGCKCKGDCTDPRNCACARLNGSDFPYVRYKNGGRLTEARDVVYECGPNCGCGAECVNRTTQRGLKYRLEVFMTAKKGWGVRSRDFIPIGSFVCEYVGVIKRTDEVKDPNNFYYFDIDLLQTMKGLDKREKRLGKAAINPSALLEKQDDEVDFCIDSETKGNITRYINHSCAPNLYVQCVLSDHHDARLARIVLFAADNIPPYQELSYDYGYGENSVKDKDGKFVHMPCHCGAEDCKGIMF